MVEESGKREREIDRSEIDSKMDLLVASIEKGRNG